MAEDKKPPEPGPFNGVENSGPAFNPNAGGGFVSQPPAPKPAAPPEPVIVQKTPSEPAKPLRQAMDAEFKAQLSKALKISGVIWVAAIAVAIVFIPGERRRVAEQRKAAELRRAAASEKPRIEPSSGRKIPSVVSAQERSVTEHTLQIQGSKEFENNMLKTLELVWQKDNPTFRKMKQYIYVIRQAERNDFVVENGIPVVLLRNKTAFRSITWCAGEFAKQTFMAVEHYKSEGSLAAIPVDSSGSLKNISGSETKSPQELEKQAVGFQLEVMRKIGADSREISIIENQLSKL